jgi:hypothetical protein
MDPGRKKAARRRAWRTAVVLAAAAAGSLLASGVLPRPAASVQVAGVTPAGAPAVGALRRLRSSRAFPTAASVRRAVAYLKTRDCEAALAVVDTTGRLRGYRSGVTYTSASVVKAMLLVEYLRTHDELKDGMRATLRLMITQSDNAAACRTYATARGSGLRRLARRAGMRDFSPGGDVLYSRITAADQARFFARLDDYVPSEWRAFAHRLLTHIVGSQTWGIAEVARPRWTVLFKSGWFGAAEDPYTLVNQVARLQRGRRIWSVAVLTDDNPHSPYAFATLRGVARRLLGGAR